MKVWLEVKGCNDEKWVYAGQEVMTYFATARLHSVGYALQLVVVTLERVVSSGTCTVLPYCVVMDVHVSRLTRLMHLKYLGSKD